MKQPCEKFKCIPVYREAIYILLDDIQIGNTLDKCVGIERKLYRYASEKSLRMEFESCNIKRGRGETEEKIIQIGNFSFSSDNYDPRIIRFEEYLN